MTKDAIRSDLRRFCADAKRSGFVTVAHGLASADVIALAVAGDYADCEAVVPAGEQPGEMIRFEIDDLFS